MSISMRFTADTSANQVQVLEHPLNVFDVEGFIRLDQDKLLLMVHIDLPHGFYFSRV